MRLLTQILLQNSQKNPHLSLQKLLYVFEFSLRASGYAFARQSLGCDEKYADFMYKSK